MHRIKYKKTLTLALIITTNDKISTAFIIYGIVIRYTFRTESTRKQFKRLELFSKTNGKMQLSHTKLQVLFFI